MPHLRFSCLLAVSALAGCAALTPHASFTAEDVRIVREPSKPVIETPETAARYYVLAGEFAASRNQPAAAAQYFLQALDYVSDPLLAARATALALTAKNEDLALQAGRQWLKAEPNSGAAREIVARLALRRGALDEAFAQSRILIESSAGGLGEGYRQVALLLSQDPDKSDAAIALTQRLVELHADLSDAHYALGLVAYRYGKLDLAERAARKSLELKPGTREATLLLAGVEVKQNRPDAADQTVEALLKSDPDPVNTRLGYAKLLLESDQREHAASQLQKVLQSDPSNADAHLALGLLALEARKPDQARPHFEALIKSGERRSEAAYYLGRIAEQQRDYAQALRWYERVTNGTQALDAAIRRGSMLAKLERLDEARAMFEQLREQFPQYTVRLYAAEGEILYDTGRYREAQALYDSVLEQLPDEPDLLYGRALVLDQLGRFDKAESDLRRMIEQDPDDARALNALGYMLTLHTERFDEARQLISKALAITPDDAAVIDSMGWLQFRIGHLNQARDLLRKAFDKLPDPEIAAHLGEALWAMGDRDQAKRIWQAGLREDPDHRVLKETMDRYLR